MEKYRVRLKTGRVVGPFFAKQILEMRTKQLITGLEDCQVFPTGDWLRLSGFDFWASHETSSVPEDGTFVADLGALSAQLKTSPGASPPVVNVPPQVTLDADKFREFDYKTPSPSEPSIKNETNVGDFILDIEDSGAPPLEHDLTEDRTVVRPSTKATATIEAATSEDKTIVTPDALKWRKQQEEQAKRQEAIRKKFEEDSRLLREQEQQAKVDYNEDATQIARVEDLRSLVQTEARQSETELQQIEEVVAENKKLQESKKAKEAKIESDDELASIATEDAAEKKKKTIIVALIALVLLALLFPEDDKKQSAKAIVPIDPVIEFPVPFSVKDPQKSDQLIAAARDLLKDGVYSKKIEAAVNYRKSYENDTDKKLSLAKMIRLYGELIPHSSKFERDGGVLFKLLQANRQLQDVDPDVALGAALFYRAIGKSDAGHDVMDRFVKSRSNNPTRELFAAFLVSLSDKNIEAKADEVAASLLKTDNRGIEVNLALIHYYRYKNYPEKAKAVLVEAMKEFPNSVPLHISRGEFCVESLDLKCLQEVITEIKEKEAEKSKLYYGKLLEFEGFLIAAQNRPIDAAAKFSEALKYNDSDTLRDRLTNIKDVDPGANDEASKLIKQIQARELHKEAVAAAKVFDFEKSLLRSLAAYGLRSGYVKADLGLAEIQMRLGMTAQAITTLENLHKQNQTDPLVNFALLEAYIDNFKFNDAKRMFAILATSELREDWRYASLNAKMYEKLGDLNQSILWLQKAINQNPLEDKNLHTLAKLFTRAKRFLQAKNNLFKAMELNPNYIEYKLAYAAIIYEVDGADKAIDYLFGLLNQFPQNPSILGEIAIYYHRAGKNQQFLDTKKDIEALPVRDPRVYRFLVKSSMLDERWDEAVKYTEELVKLEPGDLSAMMDIAKMLMQLKRYKDAAVWFVRIREKLPSYPRVGYYKALIELYVGNPDQALADVREDMKINGEYEDGVNLVGDILFKKEEFNAAEGEYKKSLRINTRSYGAIRGLADVAFKRGQLDIALDLYKRAITEMRGFSEPDVHRKLGDVYRLLGQGSLAIDSYQVYLKLVPDAADKGIIEQHIRVLE